MKIGILSMQNVINYGSVLQAISLKRIVEEISGEKVEFISPLYEPYLQAQMPIVDVDDYRMNVDKYHFSIREKYIKRFLNHFVEKRICECIKKYQREELEIDLTQKEEQYDLVIEGSDEVFKCTKKVYLHLYGSIENANHLITYAASAGSADISALSPDVLEILKKNFTKFDAMSVRDTNTEKYIGQMYTGEIFRHMDPVLMGDLYKQEHKTVREKKYMVIYAYSNRIYSKKEVEAIKTYARKNKLTTIAIGGIQNWCDKNLSLDPMRVLDYFYYAECIVTDTFHGTIFSIINHKKFVSFIRTTNRNKLHGLLEEIGLVEREVYNVDKFEETINSDIDYQKVDTFLEQQRKRTRAYLEKQVCLARESER